MAAIAINDLSSNPWIIAEEGLANLSNVKVTTLVHKEPDDPAHVAEIVDSKGKLAFRFDSDDRKIDDAGWIHGLTVDRLDSGYILVYLAGH